MVEPGFRGSGESVQSASSVTVNGDKASLAPGEKGFMLTVPDPGTGVEIILRQ